MRSGFSLNNNNHVPDWQPHILLRMVEARSVNVKKTFTQGPIPVCLDGTIIDSSTILVTTVCNTVVMLGYD